MPFCSTIHGQSTSLAKPTFMLLGVAPKLSWSPGILGAWAYTKGNGNLLDTVMSALTAAPSPHAAWRWKHLERQ